MVESVFDLSRSLLFAKRLEDDAHINEDFSPEFVRAAELDKNFLDLTNREAIDYKNLGDFMALVREEFDKAYQYKLKLKLIEKGGVESSEQEDLLLSATKRQEKADFREQLGRMSKRDLFRRLHGFFKKCLRLVRAYNFDSQLLTQLASYYDFLFKSNYVFDAQVLDMRYYFSLCFQKLLIKARADPNLKENVLFQENFAKFEAMHAEINKGANEIQAKQRRERFMKVEENQRIIKIVKHMEMSNITDMKILKRVINLVANNFQLRFSKNHF